MKRWWSAPAMLAVPVLMHLGAAPAAASELSQRVGGRRFVQRLAQVDREHRPIGHLGRRRRQQLPDGDRHADRQQQSYGT